MTIGDNYTIIFKANNIVAEEVSELSIKDRLAGLCYGFRYGKQYIIQDPLTGSLDRKLLEQGFLDELLLIARRYERDLTFLLLDIDNFKGINDRFGHVVADNILRQVSRALQSILRKSDFVIRYGGDEFLLVLPETDQEGAQTLMTTRLVDALRTFVEPRLGVSIGLSYGIAALEEDSSAQALIEKADQELYQQKKAKQTNLRRVNGE